MSCKVHLAEGVSWVKDSNQTIVIDVVHQQAHLLECADMAIWDWLMLGYPLAKIARMTAELQDLSFEAAEKSIAEKIKGWRGTGLLEITELVDG